MISEGLIPFCQLHWNEGEPLGRGSFGEVRKCTWQGILVAVKCLGSEPKAIKDALNEVSIAHYHQNNLEIYGITIDKENNVYLVEEFAEKGDLRRYLQSWEHYSTANEKIRLAWLVTEKIKLSAIDGICHGDIKADNILMRSIKSMKNESHTEPAPNFPEMIKNYEISEGLAMMNDEQMKLFVAEKNYLRVNFIPILADFNVSASLGIAAGGSLYSAAPERLSRNIDMKHWAANFPLLGDIYSCGILLWEIFSDGHKPFFASLPQKDLMTLKQKPQHIEKLISDLNSKWDKWVLTIIRWCTSMDPKKRPSAVGLAAVLKTKLSLEDKQIFDDVIQALDKQIFDDVIQALVKDADTNDEKILMPSQESSPLQKVEDTLRTLSLGDLGSLIKDWEINTIGTESKNASMGLSSNTNLFHHNIQIAQPESESPIKKLFMSKQYERLFNELLDKKNRNPEEDFLLGYVMYHGLGNEKEVTGSKVPIHDAASKGHLMARDFEIGMKFDNKVLDPTLWKEAQEMAKRREGVVAKHVLGLMYEMLGDRQAAMKLYKQSINDGNDSAKISLANLVWMGIEGRNDLDGANAARLFREAIEAQYSLWKSKKHPVPFWIEDKTLHPEYFKHDQADISEGPPQLFARLCKMANDGFSPALFYLMKAYQLGLGVEKNMQAAENIANMFNIEKRWSAVYNMNFTNNLWRMCKPELYAPATEFLAELGEPLYQYKMGLLHALGIGVDVDFAKSKKWILAAANENGWQHAAAIAGLWNELGVVGFKKNKEAARNYYSIFYRIMENQAKMLDSHNFSTVNFSTKIPLVLLSNLINEKSNNTKITGAPLIRVFPKHLCISPRRRSCVVLIQRFRPTVGIHFHVIQRKSDPECQLGFTCSPRKGILTDSLAIKIRFDETNLPSEKTIVHFTIESFWNTTVYGPATKKVAGEPENPLNVGHITDISAEFDIELTPTDEGLNHIESTSLDIQAFNGSADAQYKLAQYLLPFAASDKHDTDENLMLMHWMNEAAIQENKKAQQQIVNWILNGQYIPPDLHLAASYCLNLADENNLDELCKMVELFVRANDFSSLWGLNERRKFLGYKNTDMVFHAAARNGMTWAKVYLEMQKIPLSLDEEMFEKLPLRALADAGNAFAQVVMRGLACQKSPHGQRPLSIRYMLIYDDMISKNTKTLKDIGIPNEPTMVEWFLKIRNEWDEKWKAGVSHWYKEHPHI